MSDNKDPNQEGKTGNSMLSNLLDGAEDRQAEDTHIFDDLDDPLDLDDDLVGDPEPEAPKAEAPPKEDGAPEQGPQAIPEPKADAEVEPEKKEGADTKEVVKPASEQKGADIIDMATRKSTPTMKPNETPVLVTSAKDDADMLRRMSANAPLITGKDASLVQFNGKTGRIEPVDNEAAATLKALGDNADLYVNRAPSNQQIPMTYNPETFSLNSNPNKKARALPNPAQVQEGLSKLNVAPPTSADDRLKRATGQDVEANKDKVTPRGLPGHEGQDQQQKSQEQQPQLTPGAMLLGSVGRGLTLIFAALRQFIAWAAKKLGAIAGRAGQAVAKPFNSLKTQSERGRNKLSDQSVTAPAMSATQRAGSAHEAGTNLRQQVEARKQNLHKQAENTSQAYRKTVEAQVKTIGESLGVHKAGSTLIRSKEDYEQRLNAATPNDKTRITSAQKTIAEQSEHFRDKIESVIAHRDMNLIPMADREAILNTMQQSVSQPMKLTKMEQAALEYGTNPHLKGGKNTVETVQDAIKQASISIKEATERLKNQQAIEGVQQAQQAQRERQDTPFYSGFGQSN